MPDRFISPTDQSHSTMGSIPTSVPTVGFLIQLADGGWAFSDAGPADAGLAAVGGGGFGADDAVTTGLPLLQLGSTVFTV